MPFEIGEAVNWGTNKVTSVRIIDRLVRNPIFAALTVAIIVMIVVVWVYSRASNRDTNGYLALRTGIYTFIATAGIIFLHDKYLMSESQLLHKSSEISKVFESSPDDADNIAIDKYLVPVEINTDFTR